MTLRRKILYVTGTRADFGKLKSLITESSQHFNVEIFVTGMHLLPRFGSTWNEVRDLGVGHIFPYVNQGEHDSMSSALSKTIHGLSEYVEHSKPDLIVVHGDRIEALAGAIVGTLSNTHVAHIEGGEFSGTVDEMMRHAITKLATFHFVSNDEAVQVLLQMGESVERIFEVGSPDVDIMFSDSLPSLSKVKERYGIPFQSYAIAILHPVVTEVEKLSLDAEIFFETLKECGRSFIVIQPNNDMGHEKILLQVQKLRYNPRFRIFPSMRFEYFLTLLKGADFIIGNSSAGVREAPYFGVPCVDIGTRQDGRVRSSKVIWSDFEKAQIIEAIDKANKLERKPSMLFGTQGSSLRILEILRQDKFWSFPTQKKFNKLSL